MGGRVDRWALAALGASGLYLFFLNAWDSVPAACGAAFACCVLARRFLSDHPIPRRASRAQVAAKLLELASLTDSQAQAELTGLLAGRWPGERFQLTPVLKHPEASLSSGDILNAWKANRDADRLVVAATCPCEPRAALYAKQLRDPAVAVMDSRAIARLLRKQKAADAFPPVPPLPLRDRLRRLFARCREVRATPKDALIAAILSGLYLRTGRPLYLFSALAVMLRLGLALSRGRMGRRLFGG